MRITFLTQYFPPEVGAPQARLSELAELLGERGHQMTVLTAMPSYPTGRIFAGYGGFFRRESRGEVRVLRTAVYPTKSASLVRRLASYLSFVVSSALVGTFRLGRQDVLLVESPPLFLGMSAIWLALVTRARLVFNVSDLWPDGAIRLGLVREGSLSHRLASALERLCYRRAWLVTGQSRTILSNIAERFPDLVTFHLTNGCDTRKFGSAQASAEMRRRLDPDGDAFVATYAGLHGLAQGLQQILEAARILRDETRIRFVLVGDGPEKAELQALAEEWQLTNVRFLDPVPSAEMPALLASSDAILVTLKLFLPGAVPSKIYEAMASERPLVLVASGESAEIVGEARAGEVLAPGDIVGLAETVRGLARGRDGVAETCRRARALVENRYDRRAVAERFSERLEAR